MDKSQFRTGGLASWSVRRPISVLMLALTVMLLGLFALDGLRINLLPHLIYPEVRVRIFDSGVPTVIMEDKITRQVKRNRTCKYCLCPVVDRQSSPRVDRCIALRCCCLNGIAQRPVNRLHERLDLRFGE